MRHSLGSLLAAAIVLLVMTSLAFGQVAQTIRVRKFDDCNCNGVWDTGEKEIGVDTLVYGRGWPIRITSPTGETTIQATPYTIPAVTGQYCIEEKVLTGWKQTALIVDGVPQTVSPKARVTVSASSPTHEIIFGNVKLVCIKIIKFHDCNGNGCFDYRIDKALPNWQFEFSGIACNGCVIGPEVKTTNASGVINLYYLLPGVYTIKEIMPSEEWVNTTGNECVTVDMKPGCVVCIKVGNTQVQCADFDTKGYWHNKNGLEEITDADIAYINTLAPYSTPSSYFGAGDEPFNGTFTNGDPVDEAFKNFPLGAAGTARAEISHFLTDANATGDPREQLAQQLLAFILNVRHRLPSPDTLILVNGQYVTAQSLIDAAIAAWSGSDADEQRRLQGILDELNNSDCVEYLASAPV